MELPPNRNGCDAPAGLENTGAINIQTIGREFKDNGGCSHRNHRQGGSVQPPAIRANEAERVAALRNYHILDTPAEPRFDALTKLAATALNVPMAVIAFVDADRQWFKSSRGLDVRELPRDVLFSGHVVATEAPLVVADATQDPRFSDSPVVNGVPTIRFYAGVPLRTPDGFVVGTFCALDEEPRRLTGATEATAVEMLGLLAGQVVEILELERQHTKAAPEPHDDPVEYGELRIALGPNQFMAALDQTKEAVLVIDPASLRFTYANRGAVSHLGYAMDVLLVKTPLDFTPDLDESGYRQLLEPLITGPSRVTTFETVHRHRDGHDIPVEIALRYIAPPGEKPCFVSVVRDISERKSLDKLKREFVSIVSHELRTPLTSIRGSLGLVANGITGQLPPEAQVYVDIALSNCERLVGLINDILDIEKIRSGSTKLHMQPVDLVSIIRTAVAGEEADAAAHHVALSFVEDVPDVEVLADKDRLLQVLTNLISNAVKFGGPGKPVELSMIKQDNRIRVNVRDHGPGIPDQFAEHVFERFTQEDSSNTRSRAGAGLGLSIAKTLIEAMLGEIGFETTPDDGTTFFFDLPVLPSGQELARRSRGDTDRRALVCEADPDVAGLIEKVLDKAGCAVHVAPTVMRARELLAAYRYRIVTLDLMLADGDASTLIAEIDDCPRNPDVPVIVISAAGTEPTANLEPTMVADIQQQPVDEEHLLRSVRRILAQDSQKETHVRVLHVEDDRDLRQIVKRLLPADWEISEAATVAEARALLGAAAFDVVLLDLALPDGDGETLLGLAGAAEIVVFSASDATPALAQKVASALVKSRTTEFQLRDQMVALMARRQAGDASR